MLETEQEQTKEKEREQEQVRMTERLSTFERDLRNWIFGAERELIFSMSIVACYVQWSSGRHADWAAVIWAKTCPTTGRATKLRVSVKVGVRFGNQLLLSPGLLSPNWCVNQTLMLDSFSVSVFIHSK